MEKNFKKLKKINRIDLKKERENRDKWSHKGMETV